MTSEPYKTATIETYDLHVDKRPPNMMKHNMRYLVKLIEPDGSDRGLVGNDLPTLIDAVKQSYDLRHPEA